MQKKPPSTLLRRSFAFLRRPGTYLLGSGAEEAKRRAEQRAERLAQRRKMLWGKIDGRAVSTPTSARRWPGSRRESFTKRTLSSPETSAPFASMAATTTTRSSCADPSQELRLRTMTEREQRRAYKLQQRNNVPNEHLTNDTQATLLRHTLTGYRPTRTQRQQQQQQQQQHDKDMMYNSYMYMYLAFTYAYV